MSHTDRRSQRTQRALIDAMVELILEKGFEATNVSEIAARANVGRSTFYAHYIDKEGLLQGAVNGLRGFLEQHVQAAREHRDRDTHPALAFCLPMLEHAGENKHLFAAMVGRRSGYLFVELTHDMWTDIVRSNWIGADEVAVQSIAGAFGSTLTWWLTTAPELPVREVGDRFLAAVEPILRG